MYAVIANLTCGFLNLDSRNDLPFPPASHKVFPSTHMFSNSERKLTHSRARNHVIVPEARFTSLKCKSYLRVEAPFVLVPKRKLLKLSAFKSNSQNEESGGRPLGSKSLKNSVGLSYVPQDSESVLVDSKKPQSVPPAVAESKTGSLAVQNLFKSLLMLPNHVIVETLEKLSSLETSENQNSIKQKERIDILKAVRCYFFSLDVTVKITLLVFIPLYLAVNLMYGAEVSKELTPLWLLGPLIAALYTKLCRGIGVLYVFSFRQTVTLMINLPTYYLVARYYIAHGKLNKVVRHLFQTLLAAKNMDYKEACKRKMKGLEVFSAEKNLDFVESFWPYYCRTIRFLKRAHLI
ncbi:hypothetical protein ACH5RR_003290 [Cinchona calisaya]|uniref:Uncharacterized protein n=1 Tax=Cinchona calisaya TaxID=153742 RepID=A0ABD3AV03_9GENT